GTTVGYVDDYDEACPSASFANTPDVVYSFTPAADVTVDIDLCASSFNTKVYLYENTEGNLYACDDNGCGTVRSFLGMVDLFAGNTYYIIVDGGRGPNAQGDYVLDISAPVLGRCCYEDTVGHWTCDITDRYTCRSLEGYWVEGGNCDEPCSGPCDWIEDGLVENPDGSFTYRQTTDSSDTTPLYEGPFDIYAPCWGGTPQCGFEIYSWWNQDYGWKHYWNLWNTPDLTIQSVQVLICAWDVDEHTCNIQNPGHPEECELDNIFADGVLQNPEYLSGDNITYSITTFDIAPSALLDDGYLDMFIDIDVWNDSCYWATTLSWSQLIVTYTQDTIPNNPPYTPEGHGMPCVDVTTPISVTITGPTPPDPDGDAVTYTYRWFVKNAATGWGFVDDENHPTHPIDHSDSFIPTTDFDVNDVWRVQVFAVDEHSAQSYNPLIVDFPIVIPDCDWPYTELDMGDLDACNYPTLVNNPAHGLSNIAWLGERITGELTPNIPDLDDADDGVVYHGDLWTPCAEESVTVTVTAGTNYAAYSASNGLLYLNGWKDGNLDGDFCDELCDSNAAEWIVKDELVTPGDHTFAFNDPGVFEGQGIYDGVFRWRLTSHPVGRYGFGLIDTAACPNMNCGTFDLDFLGEVEDYIVIDLQLAVELMNFEAVPGDRSVTLRWSTASESDNDHFEVLRDGRVVSNVDGAGNSSTTRHYVWQDEHLQNGTEYTYTLIAVDISGLREELSTLHATPSFDAAVITEYALHQNYPNPFNPTTTITFDLVESGYASLKIYNLMGQEVARILSDMMDSGRHVVSFDGSNLPSGVYIYRLEVNNFSDTKKMMLMK
ncbi:T9SS type A sorting domain-containing protein, partial [bacterium]|nr:T9SS type A sorting domain-containing protein [bacterium]